MIDINFSPDPVKNRKESIYGFIIPVICLVILTAVNIGVFSYYRFKNSDIHSQISEKETVIQETKSKIAAKSSIIGKNNYKSFIRNYSFLNALILKKQLSWTRFFEEMETILPPNVKLIVISPNLKKNQMFLNITAEAVTKDQQLKLIKKMHESSYFHSPAIESESIDPGTRNIKFSMKVMYTGAKHD